MSGATSGCRAAARTVLRVVESEDHRSVVDGLVLNRVGVKVCSCCRPAGRRGGRCLSGANCDDRGHERVASSAQRGVSGALSRVWWVHPTPRAPETGCQ